MFHKLFRYFVHEPEKLTRRPRQYINPYDIREATDEQLLIMKAVQARSPEEAQRLLKEHNVANVYELLAKLQREKPSFWAKVKSRAISLFMRIEGATWQNPVYRKSGSKWSKLDVEYKWEDDSP